jgi:hypothetical protein
MTGWAADVNIYGLEIRKVEMQHLLVEGKRVISIKGEIANISSSPQKIPWLRFGLRDKGQAEVYNWQLDTNARPLNPGESTNFVTRIASPPETAGEVEIRFARADEIGSNTCAMTEIIIDGHRIGVLFSEEAIAERVKAIASAIAARKPENLLVVPILKGSFVFAADLIRAMHHAGFRRKSIS